MSEDFSLKTRADNIRDVIRYIKRFNKALLVVKFDDKVIDSPLFFEHSRDLALLANTGIKLILIAGATNNINKILESNGETWSFQGETRITRKSAINLIKMAAFETASKLMNALSAEKITGVMGNWVSAREKGIINGIDFGSAGKIHKITAQDIYPVLEQGIVPVFPCIGWSTNGTAYNVSSSELTLEISKSLKADKIFFISMPEETEKQKLLQTLSIQGHTSVSAGHLEKLLERLPEPEKKGTFYKFLIDALETCKQGVKRVHLLDGTKEGVIPCEIFSESGSGGFMVFGNNYGEFRQAVKEDIPALFSLMTPFVKEGILLPRTQEQLEENINNYTVFDVDGEIRASAALINYPEQGLQEIAALAVEKKYRSLGTGNALVHHLIKKAKEAGAKGVFILTTQTTDWFSSLGFEDGSLDFLPEARRKLWTKERNSKVMKIIF